MCFLDREVKHVYLQDPIIIFFVFPAETGIGRGARLGRLRRVRRIVLLEGFDRVSRSHDPASLAKMGYPGCSLTFGHISEVSRCTIECWPAWDKSSARSHTSFPLNFIVFLPRPRRSTRLSQSGIPLRYLFGWTVRS